MNHKYLILGIDPGTTTAFCALDLKGNLVKTFSAKNISTEKLIAEINQVGIPIIITCDVKIGPYLIEKIAHVFKAKIILPDHDLKQDEKQELIKNIPLDNIHQKDACASAIFAYKKLEPLLKRIENHLIKGELKEKEDLIKKKIILKEANTIEEALKQENYILPKISTKRQESKKPITQDKEIRELKENIIHLEDEIKNLRQENINLKSKYYIKNEDHIKNLLEKRKITIKTLENQIKEREIDLLNLKHLLQQKDKEIELIKEDKLIIRKLKNLSKEEINKITLSQKGDVLFVEDLTIPSEDSIIKLKDLKINYILFEKDNPKLRKIIEKLGFILINFKDIKIEQENNIMWVEKEELQKFKKVDIEAIITQYREKRI